MMMIDGRAPGTGVVYEELSQMEKNAYWNKVKDNVEKRREVMRSPALRDLPPVNEVKAA